VRPAGRNGRENGVAWELLGGWGRGGSGRE
jgi:hypothetical protein